MEKLLHKKFFLVVTIFWLSTFASTIFSQESFKVENNLYYRALFASLEKIENEWKDSLNRVVEKNEVIQDFPNQIGKYRVEYLDLQGLIDRAKNLKKPFSILTGSPITNEGERLRIRFTVQYFRYNNKKIMFSLSDWSDVYFRYDCQKKDYVIDVVELGGI